MGRFRHLGSVLCVHFRAAKADGVTSIDRPKGVGLLQHYGFICSYVAGPAICLWVRHLLERLNDFQTELARIHAGFVTVISDWQQRKEFPALVESHTA